MTDEKVVKIIELYEHYLDFLRMSNNGCISVAYAHGWRCPEEDILKGNIFRTSIEELKSQVINDLTVEDRIYDVVPCSNEKFDQEYEKENKPLTKEEMDSYAKRH